MAKRRTAKRKAAPRRKKADSSTLWILLALGAGVAYLMSKGTINVPGSPGVLQNAHQDGINTTITSGSNLTSVDVQPTGNFKPLVYGQLDNDNLYMV